MGGLPRRRHQGRRPAPRRVPDAPHAPARRGRRSRAAQAAGDGLRQHHPDRRRARVRRRRGDGIPDHRLEPLERGRDGHPWLPATASAATSPPSPPRPGCTRPASTTSSAARRGTAPATSSTSRATPPPASTPAPSSTAGSASSSSTTSARRRAATVCRPTRTRGGCPGCGSSPPCPWASARSPRSTRRASTATCTNRSIKDTVELARLGLPGRRRDGRARVDRRPRPRGP